MRARKYLMRITGLLLAVLMLLPAAAGAGRPETERSELLEAAFELLEEGNPFTARYEKQTGATIEPLFPWGVPYYFGGLSGSRGNGWFYLGYPDYHAHMCSSGSDYFKVGKMYFYGLDCSGFTRHVYQACGKPRHANLSDLLTRWEYRRNAEGVRLHGGGGTRPGKMAGLSAGDPLRAEPLLRRTVPAAD